MLAPYVQRLLERVVKSGGRLIVGAYGSRSRGTQPFDIAGFLVEAGFHLAGRTTAGEPPIVGFAWVDNAGQAISPADPRPAPPKK
jgi:hypothetical protein